MIDTLFAFLIVGFLLGVGNILSEASARRADAEPFHPHFGHSYGAAQAEIADALWRHPLEHLRPPGVRILSPLEERAWRAACNERMPGIVTADEFTAYVRLRHSNGYDGGSA